MHCFDTMYLRFPSALCSHCTFGFLSDNSLGLHHGECHCHSDPMATSENRKGPRNGYSNDWPATEVYFCPSALQPTQAEEAIDPLEESQSTQSAVAEDRFAPCRDACKAKVTPAAGDDQVGVEVLSRVTQDGQCTPVGTLFEAAFWGRTPIDRDFVHPICRITTPCRATISIRVDLWEDQYMEYDIERSGAAGPLPRDVIRGDTARELQTRVGHAGAFTVTSAECGVQQAMTWMIKSVDGTPVMKPGRFFMGEGDREGLLRGKIVASCGKPCPAYGLRRSAWY